MARDVRRRWTWWRSFAASPPGLVLGAAALQAMATTALLGFPSAWPAAGIGLAVLGLVVGVVAWAAASNASVVRELRSQLAPSEAAPPRLALTSYRRTREEAELVDALHGLSARLDRLLERERDLRRQAEDADRYKTAFLDSVSHELRTPLNAILGFAEILAQEIDGPLTAAQREDVEVILTSGQYLQSLFTDVLDLSAMVSGRMELQREPVDVARIIRETAQMLEGQRRDRPVNILVRIEPHLPPLAGDPRRVRQILTNLASNALKFTEAGHVTLQADATDEGVRLQVTDTGMGIAQDQLDTIFEEFAQAEVGAQRRTGSGLGLAICRRLVQLHGGRIDVESELQRGSTFRVILPAWQEPAA